MDKHLNRVLMLSIKDESTANIIPQLDKNIPLPVQVPDSVDIKDFDISSLKTEMILAALLLIFAYDRENKHIDYYRKIFNLLRPNIRKEMTDAAIIKTKNGDYENAEELLLALEGLNPKDAITKLNLALLMEERAQFYEEVDLFEEAKIYNDKAEVLYNELIGFEPPIAQVFFNAAYFFAKKKLYAKVKSLLSTYLNLESSTSETAKFRREKAEAFINLIESSSLDDDLFASAYNLINEGKDEEACNQIRDFLQKNPKIWNAWFLLGWALRKQNRWEDAKASFEQALNLINKTSNKEPSYYSDIYNELAICNMELNFFEEAEKNLYAALEYEPENIKIISNLGTLALRQNKNEEAQAFFRTVLAINPNDSLAKDILGIK